MCKKNLKNYLETVKYPCSLCPTASTTAWNGAEDCHQQPSNYWWSGVCLATPWRQTNSCRCSHSHPYRAVILSIHYYLIYSQYTLRRSWELLTELSEGKGLGESWLSNRLVPIWMIGPFVCRKVWEPYLPGPINRSINLLTLFVRNCRWVNSLSNPSIIFWC